MSCWTHIIATIDIDTHEYKDDLVAFVKNKLQSAPPITGSEGNANIFVNVLPGYNFSTSCDCSRCKHKETRIPHKEGGFSCSSPEDFVCPEGDYQTRVLISIVGDLRDKGQCETKEEYKQFIKFLKMDCDFSVLNHFSKIKGW